MEHDGHLNREYKKEVLLGNHEEFEWESEKKLVKRLKDIFKRCLYFVLYFWKRSIYSVGYSIDVGKIVSPSRDLLSNTSQCLDLHIY